MVRAVGMELRVWAIADVGAMEGGGEGSFRQVAWRGGQLVDGGEVAGEDVFGINGWAKG